MYFLPKTERALQSLLQERLKIVY